MATRSEQQMKIYTSSSQLLSLHGSWILEIIDAVSITFPMNGVSMISCIRKSQKSVIFGDVSLKLLLLSEFSLAPRFYTIHGFLN